MSHVIGKMKVQGFDDEGKEVQKVVYGINYTALVDSLSRMWSESYTPDEISNHSGNNLGIMRDRTQEIMLGLQAELDNFKKVLSVARQAPIPTQSMKEPTKKTEPTPETVKEEDMGLSDEDVDLEGLEGLDFTDAKE